MVMKCARCKRVIEPDEVIVVVATGEIRSWTEKVAERFERSLHWHFACAPKSVRQYASPVIEGDGRRGIETIEL